MERLSDTEIKQVLSKIEKTYIKYAALYGEKIFDYKNFKNRYLDFLYTKGMVELFLFAEIQALDDLKNEIEEKKAKRVRVQYWEDQMEAKAEALFQKIAHYPDDNFHPEAREEIRKLIAVMKVVAPQLEKHRYDVPSKYEEHYRKCLTLLKDFTLKPYSGTLGKYVSELCFPMKNFKKREVLEQALLKELAVALSTFHKGLNLAKPTAEIKEFIAIIERIREDFRLDMFKPL